MTAERTPSSPNITATMLANIGVFGGLDEDSLDILASSLPMRRVEAGELVVSEGDDSRDMFIIVGGELEVLKKGGGKDIRVALLGPNDWFGEMSIVDVQPRSATVRAVAPTLLLSMSPEHVEKLLYRRDVKAYALFIMNVARELSRKLRVADGILAQFYAAVTEQYGAVRPTS